jgi:LacI family repressor for deo operon, udp, cdd, tsx, nupC, and nupG
MLRRNEADGMIVLGHRLPPTAREIVQQRGAAAPVVNGCEFDPRWAFPASTSTTPPPHAVMEHLYALGHERIAVVGGPPDNPLHQQRLEGVRAAGKARGRLRQLSIVPGDFSVESGHAAAMALLDGTSAPTAIFCFSDRWRWAPGGLPRPGHPRAGGPVHRRP